MNTNERALRCAPARTRSILRVWALAVYNRAMKTIARVGVAALLICGACADGPMLAPTDAQRADRGTGTDTGDSASTVDSGVLADTGAMDVVSVTDVATDTVTDTGEDAPPCPTIVGDDGTGVFPSTCNCVPNTTRACSIGPRATAGVGACRRGVQRCIGSGELGRWSDTCEGAVAPTTERCDNMTDDDCDGTTDEDCGCMVGSTMSCYSGPAGTMGMGACRAGTRTCMAGMPATFGACVGEVLPRTEVCGNGVDDDCDGMTDEGCGTCSPATVMWPIPAGTVGGPECIRTGGGTCEAMVTCTGSSCRAPSCGQPHCGTLRCNDGSYVRAQYCTVIATCTSGGITTTGFTW